MSDAKPPPWEHLKSAKHAACRIFDVMRETFRHPLKGIQNDFFVINTSNWANVCALTPEKELVMVRQFRYGLRELVWEFPGGIVDPHEDPLQAGLRELKEETGFEGRNPRIMATVWPNPAIMNNVCTLIRVDHAVPRHNLSWDPHEDLEVKTFPIAQVREWARSGQFKHSIALNQLYFLELALSAESPDR